MLASITVGAASRSTFVRANLSHRTKRPMGSNPPTATTPVRHVAPPHPDYKPGDPQPAPFETDATVAVDPATISGGEIYPLVISAITPRPIAFISSQSASGIRNLSPYSYFNVLAHDPPHVAIGHCHSPSKPDNHKDSLANILETGEFVVSIISDWFVEAANHTCGPYDFEVDEFQLANLTPVPSERITPPRVKESAVNMECKLVHTYEVKNRSGEVTTTIVIGEVLLFHLLEGAVGKSPHGKTVVDPVKLRPISRFGGNTYGRVTELFDIPRPTGDAAVNKETKGVEADLSFACSWDHKGQSLEKNTNQ